MAIDPRLPSHSLPVGSVIEQGRGEQAYLVVQEAADRTSIIASWDDLMDFTNRVLRRVGATLDQMNADLAAFNEKLSKDVAGTTAKIAANQRLVDELVKGRS